MADKPGNADIMEAEVIAHFNTYLVIDNKPLYRVSWDNRGAWAKGAKIGLSITGTVDKGSGEVNAVLAEELALIKKEFPGKDWFSGK